MISVARKGFTRLEMALGLCVVAGVLMLTLPAVWRGTGQDRPRRAVHRAQALAAAVLDYRAEMGQWPASAGGSLDVACLTRSPARAGGADRRPTLAGAAVSTGLPAGGDPARPWLEEIPVDPWGHPYRTTLALADGQPGIAVVSAGPDGVFQTDSGRVVRGFAGDDVGVVMFDQTDGGSRP